MKAPLAMAVARLGLVLTVVLATAALTMTAGRAYNNSDVPCPNPYAGGSSYLYLYWEDDPIDPPYGYYVTAYSLSRGNWTGTATPTFFTPGQYVISLQVKNAPNSYLGLTTAYCSGGTRYYTEVYLNNSMISSQSNNYKRSVAAHELGHVIGLGHSTVSGALMNQSRNRETVYQAQSDDVCGVNNVYTSTSWPPTCGY